MKLLVLGATGMLGSAVFRHFSGLPGYQVTGSVRTSSALGAFPEKLRLGLVSGVDIENHDALARLIDEARPDAVVNCVGLVKQRAEAEDPLAALPINALLPHRLSRLCSLVGARLLHISTDCVFSGRKGGYVETDPSDAEDLYGRTKLLGEVYAPNALTLRTSIIGPELARKTGLLEWFLSQRGTIRGFRRAIFSGFTTMEMARIMELVLTRHPPASGLYHVSSDPISKYDLLGLIRTALNFDVEIVPEDQYRCDRSLDSTRFRTEFGYRPPTWEAMVEELARHLRGAAG